MRVYLIFTFLCQLIIQTAVGQINFATPYTFITMAGGGTKDTNGHPVRGFENGQGPGVKFQYPLGVVVDKRGNVYVGDTYNQVIRKIIPSGVVTTFAGVLPQEFNSDGTRRGGYRDGPASNALFSGPIVGCIDSPGNLYVCDRDNNFIRKIDPEGIVTTIAGSARLDTNGYGIGGYADGIGTNALFQTPAGLAIDSAGNLYVADANNDCIRRVTPDGNVTTIAGKHSQGYADGIGTNALFSVPTDIVIDSAGNLFVTANHCIREITPVIADGLTNWTVTTLAGYPRFSTSHNDGTGTNANFSFVDGIAMDTAGNLYVTEENNNTVRKVTPSGEVTTVAGVTPGYADGTGSEVEFYYNIGIDVDALGNVYVADNGNNVIRKGWNATAKPVIAFDSPSSTNGTMQLNFTVLTGTATNFTLLETPELGAAWTTNATAIATTNVLGLSYTYSVPITNTARFYQVQAQ